MSEQKTAITFGRYNIVTNAHLNTLERILEIWATAVIGIVSPEKCINFPQNPRLIDFFRECDKNHERKPTFTIPQRIEMWEETLRSAGFFDRVKIVEMRRPEYFPDEFNMRFPSNMYQLVFPQAKDERNKFDIIRLSAFREILGRDIATVCPSLTMHTSDIIGKVNDIDDLKRYIPIGCFSVLSRIKG